MQAKHNGFGKDAKEHCRNRLAMSAERMPTCPASAAQGFSSTPLKSISRKDLHISRDLEDCVPSEDEDTFSLLSPIYHDSFDSDEEQELSPAQRLDRSQTSPRQSHSSSISPVRCELPKTPSELMASATELPAASPSLSAWEVWLVNKAKDERLKLEKKAEEERLLKEKKEQQEREQEQKKIVTEEKIQKWLLMKREQDKQEQVLKKCREQEEIQKQQAKQRETQRKAQEKYRDWLQKKNQEKMEKEKKEKEDAIRKEEQEKERQEKAKEKFKEWLRKTNEKSRASPKSACSPRSPYGMSYPSPSFYNPIPWKPIHVPPPETPANATSNRKPQKQRKSQQSSSSAARLKSSVLKRR
ncbi:hypothetical protein LDENG_00205710 [Lucifuga dentata]|nr:hypothetical protein LDENG_00205710 [Lucifuga dentata]